MKDKIFTLGLMSILCVWTLVGCQKEEQTYGKDFNTIITVKSNNAKTHYNPASHAVEWDNDDHISVMRGSSSTGGLFVDFELLSREGGEATFGGNIPEGASGNYYAIYPSQDNLVGEQGKITCEAIQTYQRLTENSFGKGNNTSVGYNNSTEMKFFNVGGLAKIAVRGPMAIKSIKITNNESEDNSISGRGTINLMDENRTIDWAAEGTYNYVVASVPDNGAVSVNEPKIFYIVLPPCTLNDYSITLTDDKDNILTKRFSPSAPLSISRASVTMLGAFDVSFIPPNDQIWYTTSDNNPLGPSAGTTLGNLGVISNSFDTNSQRFVLTCGGDITNIPDGTFADCGNLTSVMLPNSVTTIGNSVFSRCTSLTTASLPMVSSIGNNAFSRCYALTTASMPKVSIIPPFAFLDCWSLSEISLSDVTSVGLQAFENCTSLTHAYMPKVTTVGNDAFSGCSALTFVSVPLATSIGESAFESCNNLTTVSLPLVTTIENKTFSECFALTSVSMPLATTIGESAFYLCEAMTTVYLPKATTVKSRAFYGCWSLPSISMPEVASIGDLAFRGCIRLTTVTIPQVNKIGERAFKECGALTRINYNRTIAPNDIGDNAFENVPEDATIYVPAGYDVNSKWTGWSPRSYIKPDGSTFQ